MLEGQGVEIKFNFVTVTNKAYNNDVNSVKKFLVDVDPEKKLTLWRNAMCVRHISSAASLGLDLTFRQYKQEEFSTI